LREGGDVGKRRCCKTAGTQWSREERLIDEEKGHCVLCIRRQNVQICFIDRDRQMRIMQWKAKFFF
jgi:hypothetical protein